MYVFIFSDGSLRDAKVFQIVLEIYNKSIVMELNMQKYPMIFNGTTPS